MVIWAAQSMRLDQPEYSISGALLARPGVQRTMNLSSAGDKTSSPVLPSHGPSNSAPEEFPIGSGQENANEHSSSASRAGESRKVESKADAVPARSPEEPGDDVDIPLKTKPLPKVNAAAREVRVRVTGARVGSVSGERELFTESTTTVLVFESGGVIRLTAAVAPGQLLFLSNEESKCEVVAQVMRKRTYRPTECYVEFEFTAPAPGFWGMEFSAATPLLPKDAKEAAAVELVASSETTEDELDERAPHHSAEEVEALKKEVEALRRQLNQFQTETYPGPSEQAGAISNPPSMPFVDTNKPQAETPTYQTERTSWTELSAPAFPTEGEPKPSCVYAAEPDLLPKPTFHVPVPKRKRSIQARGQFTPGFRSGMLRLGVLGGVLAALIGFVWYKHWLPWMHQSTKFSVSTFAAGVTTKVSAAETSPVGPASLATQPTANAGASEPLSAKAASPSAGSSSETSGEVAAGNEKEMAPYEVIQKPAAKERSKPAASIAAKRAPVRSLPTKMANSVPTPTGDPIIVPPKLIKSERAIATLEDLRDFETGSVVIDAVIDTAGNVTAPTVLSGPPSLRKPALEAVKYYKYQPAMQKGRPVLAHVTVKIQFHFE